MSDFRLYRDENDNSGFYEDGALALIDGVVASGDLYWVYSLILKRFGVVDIFQEDSEFLLEGVEVARTTAEIDELINQKTALKSRAAEIEEQIRQLEAERDLLL